MPAKPDVETVLHAAVEAIGGIERPGQVTMAEAVREALESGTHLLVQAGTGTGKSLAYLVPSLLRGKRVVVATATLNLQHQLVERDIPASRTRPRRRWTRSRTTPSSRAAATTPACTASARAHPTTRACSSRCRTGRWAARSSSCASGPRSRPPPATSPTATPRPSHTERAWRQVSVNHRECLGASRCAHALECFAERAREDAQHADLVVTNHALLAIDAIDGVPMLPEYDAVIVDEAHELAARVTQAATDELDPAMIERAARRARAHAEGKAVDDLTDAADALSEVIARTEPGRIDVPAQQLPEALALVRDSARACFSSFPKEKADMEADAARQQARGMVDDVRQIAERMAVKLETEVLWLDESRNGPRLHIAPIDVSSRLRDKLFDEKTVVLTSATLTLGGGFDPLAASLGLEPGDDSWTSIDVGSPFDYRTPGHALRRQAPAGAGPRRARRRPVRRDRRAGGGRRRTHARAVLVATRRGAGRRGGAQEAARPRHLVPGRRPAARAGPSVRRRPGHLPVRHPEPLAGHRPARRHLPAGDHRPHPVPAARRPADERTAAAGREARRQRLHDASPRATPRCCWRRGPAG